MTKPPPVSQSDDSNAVVQKVVACLLCSYHTGQNESRGQAQGKQKLKSYFYLENRIWKYLRGIKMSIALRY